MDEFNPLVTRTPEQIKLLRAYALANDLPEQIYENFAIYAEYMVPKIKVGKQWYPYEWFHYHICGGWQQAIFGNGTLLSIEVGPQIGKSILTALAISMIHGVSPDTSVMYATYNEAKAAQFTKQYLFKFMGTEKYKKIFPWISLKYELDKKDSSSEGAIQRKGATMKDTQYTLSNPIDTTNYLGGYRCFGLDQGIHGLPADVFIIDDYVDKGDSVKSENFRSKRREWFYNDMPSRLQDNSSIIVAICTRWYVDDIIGMLHSTYYDSILPDCEAAGITAPILNKIRIRAEYRDTDDNPACDPRRINGEKLWKVHILKYSIAKKGMYYQAVYNCDPWTTENAPQLKAEHFGYYEPHELPKHGYYDIIVDPASSTTGRSDSTAIGIFWRSGDSRYLVELLYKKWSPLDLCEAVYNVVQKYSGYHDLLIEYASSGQTLHDFLNKIGVRHVLLNFASRAVGSKQTIMEKARSMTKANSKSDRFYRALPFIALPTKPIKLSKVPIEHQDEYIRQLTTFTAEAGKKDDFVDITSHYINYTAQNTIHAGTQNRGSIAIDGYTGDFERFGSISYE